MLLFVACLAAVAGRHVALTVKFLQQRSTYSIDFLSGFPLALNFIACTTTSDDRDHSTVDTDVRRQSKHPQCTVQPCVEPAPVKLVKGKEGFPSFSNYRGQPITVTYDGRSILLNGDRALFLGGSIHPSRATKHTWEAALDEAVFQGLNLITIYVIWAAHQPVKDIPLDWILQYNASCAIGAPSHCSWDLSQAIEAVASRGLFVHIRVGPYVCAEYSYGGIPDWLPLMNANISLRRPNQAWMNVMEDFVTKTVVYLTENRLFAHQGGPIMLAQIENELDGDVNVTTENLVQVDHLGNFIVDAAQPSRSSVDRNATLRDYADWCGDLVQRLAPQVVWTMCSGLSATNTINTYNGFFDDVGWMQQRGESGRIQVDHPALWTEDEGIVGLADVPVAHFSSSEAHQYNLVVIFQAAFRFGAKSPSIRRIIFGAQPHDLWPLQRCVGSPEAARI